MAALFLSALLLTTPPAVEANASSTAAEGSRWGAAIQIGFGRAGAMTVGVIQPRLSFHAEGLELTLGPPIWLRLDAIEGALWEGRDPQRIWLTDWQSPAAYAAFVQRLSLHLFDDALQLDVGPLRQERLGRGILVDDLQSSFDPLRPRPGARIALRAGPVAVRAMVDGVVDPTVIAASFDLAPLVLLGLDGPQRFHLTLEAAVDPEAPLTAAGAAAAAAADPASPRRGAVAAADVALSYLLWRDNRVALELYAAAALLSHPALGGHAGLRVEVWRPGSNPAVADQGGDPGATEEAAVVAAIEGVAAGEGYTPGYFDIAYGDERLRTVGRDDQPKAALRPAAGFGLRGRLEFRLGGLHLGLAAQSAMDGHVSAHALLRLRAGPVALSALYVKRDLTGFRQLWQLDPGTTAVVEGAVALWQGLFAFVTLHHGRRQLADSGQGVASDWLIGLGYAAEGT